MKYMPLLLILLSFGVTAGTVYPGITPTTTINCALPTEREDNTPLLPGEIAEIRFYSGIAAGIYTLPVNSTAGVCQWVIDNTAHTSGTELYIAVTAVDSDGRESQYSAERTHIILVKLPPKAPVWLD